MGDGSKNGKFGKEGLLSVDDERGGDGWVAISKFRGKSNAGEYTLISLCSHIEVESKRMHSLLNFLYGKGDWEALPSSCYPSHVDTKRQKLLRTSGISEIT